MCMKRELPHVRTNASLDDRLVTADSCDPLPRTLEIAKQVDDCFGAVLNGKKSSWSSTKLPSRRRRKLCELIDYTRSLVYLGVDVLVRDTPWCEPRVRMKQRVRAVVVRSELNRVLPPSQRGILLAGGTSFGVRQLKPMSSNFSGAFGDSVAKRYGKRIYSLHAWFSLGRLHVFRLRICGRIVHSVWVACMEWWKLAVQLLSTGVPRVNSRQEVQRSIPPLWKVMTVCHLKLKSSSMPRVKMASWMSNLRSFLRLAVSRFMALVRPRDIGSLTGGIVDDPLWRHALCGVMHRHSGPSLLCAGQWSKMGLVVAGLAEDGICPRCKEPPENLTHRLWSCRANERYRFLLNSLAPAAVSFLDSLPHTLARTGIPPAGWNLLSLEEFKCLLNFLWCCVLTVLRLREEHTGGCLKPHRLLLIVCKLSDPR